MLKFITLFVAPFIMGFAASADSVNVDSLELKSTVFNNTRTIRVLLPQDYYDPENNATRYPVLYLTDGIMVFRTNRINISEVVYNLVAKKIISPMIVVGIDNGGSTYETKNPDRDRTNEFLPYPDVGFPPNNLYEPDPPDPQGKLYPEFLVNDVMPLIENRYRVATGPVNTGIGGFSYGGAAALYSAISLPGVFGCLMLESTPLWIGIDRQLLKDADSAKYWPAKVYIGVGTDESPDEAVNNEGRMDIDSLQNIIRRNAPDTEVMFFLDEGAKHAPSAWRKRLPQALEFLFGVSRKER